jgi:hypothetical protein
MTDEEIIHTACHNFANTMCETTKDNDFLHDTILRFMKLKSAPPNIDLRNRFSYKSDELAGDLLYVHDSNTKLMGCFTVAIYTMLLTFEIMSKEKP